VVENEKRSNNQPQEQNQETSIPFVFSRNVRDGKDNLPPAPHHRRGCPAITGHHDPTQPVYC
jgi:hypothetical protein